MSMHKPPIAMFSVWVAKGGLRVKVQSHYQPHRCRAAHVFVTACSEDPWETMDITEREFRKRFAPAQSEARR